MSRHIKVKALSMLNNAGVFELVKFITKNQFTILTYHRFGALYVTRQSFECQIEYLKKQYNIIDLNTLLKILSGEEYLLPNSILLTVDDGYQDFYTTAFPVLKRWGVSATVFLTTDFIDNGLWLWHDKLNFGIAHTSRTDFTLHGSSFELTTNEGKVHFKLALDRICTSLSATDRDAFINSLLKELGITVPEHPTREYAPLTWDQVSEMSKWGITFGAHTRTHPILTKISLTDAFREIEGSKRRIEAILGHPVSSFCYPNGTAADFNEDVKAIVKECGFECAMSTVYGMNLANSDKYALRRMAANGTSFPHFLQDVSGFGLLRKKLQGSRKHFLRLGMPFLLHLMFLQIFFNLR